MIVPKRKSDVIPVSMLYSQEILPAIFCNETAILSCSIFALKTILRKTLIVQTKTGPKRDPEWEYCKKDLSENETFSPCYHAVEG